jgi:2-keto-4-pentenoate hydratase/2-oxohepta-3-ene-1,7-dioic acid hydratase in catechol pathway
MRGAIRFHHPAGQQQTLDDAQHLLLLFSQANHADNVTGLLRHRNNAQRLSAEKWKLKFRWLVNRKSNIVNLMAAIGRFQKGEDIFYAKVVEGELFRLRGDIFGSPSFDRKVTPRKGVKTLIPVVPTKVICVGLNYADHARETGKPLPKEPLIWFKATTSLIPDGGKIEIPFPQHRTDYEAELCIVIGRKIRNVATATASRYILGYTTAQDISDRTIQNAESQWARAKSFDTFTPLGPYVETKIDPNELNIQLFQNGQLRQNSNTKQLIFKPAELVSFISTNLTLLPGDVILTGTPSGVGPIQSGDKLEVRIQGLAPLVNSVK